MAESNDEKVQSKTGEIKHEGIIGEDNFESYGEPNAKILKLDPSVHLPLTIIDVESKLTDKDFVNSFKKHWVDQLEFSYANSNLDVKLYAEPFRLCTLKNFLSDKDVVKKLACEINEVEWSRKQMDLYEFYQSADLSNAKTPYLCGFYEMLQKQVKPLLEEMCDIKLNNVSASCSMYNCGDYLLVHDDLLKDRQIAFIFYLSPWKDVEVWTEKMGGCLEIFNTDENCFPVFPVEKKIFPTNNQFAFFKVGSKSFHQVGEVTNFDYPRLTINGWFHGDSNDDIISNSVRLIDLADFKKPLSYPINLSEYVNSVYLTDSSKKRIQNHIEENSEICLQDFLLPNVFIKILEQLLNDTKLIWRLKGPANAQCYEILDSTNIEGFLKNFFDLLSSDTMFSLLHEYTDLDLAGRQAKNPCFTIEIQKWLPGSYTVLGDESSCKENSLDVIFYLNSTENVGVVTYLSPVDDDAVNEEETKTEDDSVLLTITPQDNSFNMVYRCAGTTKFTKYVSKTTTLTKDKYRMYATLSFMIVVIIVGVPMWWKTTEVYRVSLPNSAIKGLRNQPVKIKLSVGVYTEDPNRSQLLVQELDSYFRSHEIWDIGFRAIFVDNAQNLKTPATLEAKILKNIELSVGDFLFIEWPKLTEDVLLTSDRSAFISKFASSSKLQNVLQVLILQTHKIESIIKDDKRYGIKSSPPQPKYDILVSILNSRPDLMDIKWNIQMATEIYLAPFLQRVSDLSEFTLKTQWKYQVPFEFSLRQVRDNSTLGRHYALSEDTLPHIITSIEKNLGVGINDNSVINLVVYVPPCDIAPLHIYKNNDEKSTSNDVNSFISPKWGGIIIHNPPTDVCLIYNENLEKVSFHVATNDVMQIMLYHLRKLLDIHVDINMNGVKAVDIEQIEPRKWEYESFLRRSVVSYIITSSQTLHSLIELLDNISYIVINDEVGKDINEAYEKIVIAKKYLLANDLMNALKNAKEAFISSEKAFFDASLLAQLYFPDEQKYAIYIPLFLPIMVPVVTSLSVIKKFFSSTTDVKIKLS